MANLHKAVALALAIVAPIGALAIFLPGAQTGGVPQPGPLVIAEPPEGGPEVTFTPYWDPSVNVIPGYLVLLEYYTQDITQEGTWSDVVQFTPANGAYLYSDPFPTEPGYPPLDVAGVQDALRQGTAAWMMESGSSDKNVYVVDNPTGGQNTYWVYSDPVPEPASFGAVLLGLALISRRRRRE